MRGSCLLNLGLDVREVFDECLPAVVVVSLMAPEAEGQEVLLVLGPRKGTAGDMVDLA